MRDEHETLVQLVTRGEDAAIDSLLERHLAGLEAFVRLRTSKALRTKESVSDLVQSVCREVLQDLGGFEYRGESAFRGWLFTVALNKIQDRARFYAAEKRAAGRERDAGGAPAVGRPSYSDYYGAFLTPSRVAMGREEARLVEDAFAELPEDHREALTLARIAGLSLAEVAERMDRTEGSVRGLLQRAMTRLSFIMSRHRLPGE